MIMTLTAAENFVRIISNVGRYSGNEKTDLQALNQYFFFKLISYHEKKINENDLQCGYCVIFFRKKIVETTVNDMINSLILS